MLRRPCILLIALLTLAGPVFAQSPVDVLLRQRGEAFAAAMKAQGDALTAFARDHLESRLSAEGRTAGFAERMRATVEELGPVEGYDVQVPSNTLVFVYLKHAKGGAWQNYQFRVVSSDGHRLQLVFRAVAIEPLERTTATLGTEEAGRWMKRLQAQLERQQPFSGVAVVHRGGKDVFSLIQGVADATTKTAVTRSSRFGMASGSKMFTAIGILQLAQGGKLALTDPLIAHLPDFPDQAFAKRVTLHQLLTHTAGAGNYWDDDYEKAWGSITELRQMLPFVLRHLGETASGQFVYSNSGFVLLGLVIEAVSGIDYFDYVDKHVLAPAGMTATGFPVRGGAAGDRAQPYVPEMDAGAVRPGVYKPVDLGARGSSAGGASTTVDDLLRFADALRRGRLLDKAHLDLLARGHVPYGSPDTAYGYGTIVEASRGVTSFGHGGRARGTHFELKIYPELDTVLVVMSNYDTIGGPEISSALDHLIRNGGVR